MNKMVRYIMLYNHLIIFHSRGAEGGGSADMGAYVTLTNTRQLYRELLTKFKINITFLWI